MWSRNKATFFYVWYQGKFRITNPRFQIIVPRFPLAADLTFSLALIDIKYLCIRWLIPKEDSLISNICSMISNNFSRFQITFPDSNKNCSLIWNCHRSHIFECCPTKTVKSKTLKNMGGPRNVSIHNIKHVMKVPFFNKSVPLNSRLFGYDHELPPPPPNLKAWLFVYLYSFAKPVLVNSASEQGILCQIARSL